MRNLYPFAPSMSRLWSEATRLAQGRHGFISLVHHLRATQSYSFSLPSSPSVFLFLFSPKENNNVTMFREKIKDFLAAQGMIKGHSGSGTRSSDQEGMLVLITDHGRSDTSSPHSPALSIDSVDDRRHNGHNISSLRHDPHYPSISLTAQHSHPGYSSQRMSFSSARESSPLNLPRLPSAYHPLPDMSADAREGMNSELILPFSPPPSSSNILPPPPSSLVSPMSQSWHHSNQNPSYHSYSAPPVPLPVPPTPTAPPIMALVPAQPQAQPTQPPRYQHHQHQHQHPHQHQPQHPVHQAPASTSAVTSHSHFTNTLPPSYHQQYIFEEEDYNEAEQLHPGYYIEPSHNQVIAPFISSHQSGLVRHYLDHVLQRQYLLADTSIAEFITRTVQQNPAVRDAVCLLASLHQESLRQGSHAATAAQSDALVLQIDASSDYSKTYKRICANLRTSAAGGYTEGEAMAGLFVVSAFLFRGGRGAWQEFLSVAADWVWNVLHMGPDPAETILRCTDSQQFVIKTTFWFDILASTTRLQPPRFLNVYRKLWSSRRGAYIEGTNGGGGLGSSTTTTATTNVMSSTSSSSLSAVEQQQQQQPQPQPQPQQPQILSMMSVMGCENSTALALAEISALACWKEARSRQGSLSIPELVDRGRAIESEYLPRKSLAAAAAAAAATVTGDGLYSTYPGCPEIREGVQETIECLRRIPARQGQTQGGGDDNNNNSSGSNSNHNNDHNTNINHSHSHSSSSNSSNGNGNNNSKAIAIAIAIATIVVFGICLCGCLTDDYSEREFLLRRIDEEQAEGVGNCAEARS
ncbi:hypothetical protein B0F90DRAFT_1707070, partial [Multifurca ochricompacta]